MSHNEKPKGSSSWLSTMAPTLIFNHNASYNSSCQHSVCSNLWNTSKHSSRADCWKITIAERENPPPLHKLAELLMKSQRCGTEMGMKPTLGET